MAFIVHFSFWCLHNLNQIEHSTRVLNSGMNFIQQCCADYREGDNYETQEKCLDNAFIAKLDYRWLVFDSIYSAVVKER